MLFRKRQPSGAHDLPSIGVRIAPLHADPAPARPALPEREPGPEAKPEPGLPLAEVVDALYAALISRPPKSSERAEGVAILRARGATALVAALADQTAFKARVADVRAQYGLGLDRLVNDVSQNGEVEALLKQIVNRACPTRTVVDVGANGVHGSNAYDLMKHLGWRGLLVEANPALVEEIMRDFAGLDCVVEACAVSDYEGEASFTLGLGSEVSSLDEARAAKWGPTTGQLTVPVRRLGALLDRHAIPHGFDLLSLDIEGHDVRVLNDLIDTTPYRPAWIILEGPVGGFEHRLDVIGCSPAVIANYRVVATTTANLIMERIGAAPGPGRA
jgi:FkbM family methyltransferase